MNCGRCIHWYILLPLVISPALSWTVSKFIMWGRQNAGVHIIYCQKFPLEKLLGETSNICQASKILEISDKVIVIYSASVKTLYRRIWQCSGVTLTLLIRPITFLERACLFSWHIIYIQYKWKCSSVDLEIEVPSTILSAKFPLSYI